MSQKTIRQENPTAKTVRLLISAVGLAAFAFSLYSVAARPINFNWVLLILVVVLALSRVDITIPQAPPVVKVKDLFIFTSVLLFGPMPSVILAGADSAITSRNQNNKRGEIILNMALM